MIRPVPGVMAVLAASLLVACVEPPANPMEQQVRLAVGAEFAAQNCAGYAGGYVGAQQMRADAGRAVVTARNLGATEADFARARVDVQTVFATAAAFTNRQEACNSLVSSIAWHAGG